MSDKLTLIAEARTEFGKGFARRARMAGTITIMFAFAAQQEAIQALILPHGGQAVPAAGQHQQRGPSRMRHPRRQGG